MTVLCLVDGLAVDTPGVPAEDAVTRLGDGIGIKVFDSSMISHRALVDARLHERVADRVVPRGLQARPVIAEIVEVGP